MDGVYEKHNFSDGKSSRDRSGVAVAVVVVFIVLEQCNGIGYILRY